MEKHEYESSNTYFIRHTDNLAVSREAVSELYEQDKIFIHYPDCENDPAAPDKESKNWKDYNDKSAQSNIKTLQKLSEEGGIVWAQYYTEKKFIKIGIVPQESDIMLEKRYRWEKKARVNKLF